MSASSRDLSIPDGLILFLPAVPGMLFLYIAEVIPGISAGLGLELGLSGYALLEAVFIGCALSPAAGLPLYCWYFFRRGLGSNPLYPALFYLAQSFASILGMTLLVRSLLFPDAPAEELSGFLLPLLIALGLLLPLMTGISAGICRLARRRMGR